MGAYVYTLRKKELVTKDLETVYRYQYAYKPFFGWGDNPWARKEAVANSHGERAATHHTLKGEKPSYLVVMADKFEDGLSVYETPNLRGAVYDDHNNFVKIGTLRKVYGKKYIIERIEDGSNLQD